MEDQDPNRTVQLRRIEGHIRFEDVHFSYEPNKEVLHGISFRSEPGTVTALGRAFWLRQIHDYWFVVGVLHANYRQGAGG